MVSFPENYIDPLKVTFRVIISVSVGSKLLNSIFVNSSCMLLGKKTLLIIWLNPGSVYMEVGDSR